MAITFTKQPSETELLPAFNNNIAEFSSDLTNVTHCILSIPGQSDKKIYPIGGVFWYNFKALFKKIINSNNFSDDLILTVDNNTQLDNSMFQKLAVTYTVYNSTTNDLILHDYIAVKTVHEYGEPYEDLATPEIFIEPKELTYWEGYPFDVSFYSENTIATTMYADDDVATSVAINISEGLNRLALDDGANSFDSVLDFNNSITILNTTEIKYYVKKRNECDGVYLKWYSKKNGWLYWLFNPKKRTSIDSKSLGVLNNDFSDAGDSISPFISLGKTSNESTKLNATGLDIYERNVIETIVESPKVYLFTGLMGVQADLNYWLEIEVTTAKFITDDYGKSTFKTEVDIKVPRNTMAL